MTGNRAEIHHVVVNPSPGWYSDDAFAGTDHFVGFDGTSWMQVTQGQVTLIQCPLVNDELIGFVPASDKEVKRISLVLLSACYGLQQKLISIASLVSPV